MARVPYLAITNAYWSPYARRRIPLPELPLTRWFGLRAATALFRLARPLAFAHHAAALNRVRKEYGLPGLGPDLRRIYTEADHVLYADIPELVPTFDRPAHHHYLGPIQWSIPVATPPWWHELPVDRPSVYVTLGSSGRGSLLSTVLDALAGLPVNVLAADPGQAHQAPIPPNARVARYLPGGEAAARSRLVICNGGSPTTHQALAVGTPVLGLAGNMDQHLNMESVQEYGAGRLVRIRRRLPCGHPLGGRPHVGRPFLFRSGVARRPSPFPDTTPRPASVPCSPRSSGHPSEGGVRTPPRSQMRPFVRSFSSPIGASCSTS